MSDEYGGRTRGGDQWGGDWADWRLPHEDTEDAADDIDRASRIRSRAQRLRDELRDVLPPERWEILRGWLAEADEQRQRRPSEAR